MNCLRTGKGSAVTNSSVLLIWSTRKVEESDIIDLEKRYWLLKAQSRTGRFDLETFGPLVSPPIRPSLSEVCFKVFDVDRDGVLSRVELKDMVVALLEVWKDNRTDDIPELHMALSDIVEDILNAHDTTKDTNPVVIEPSSVLNGGKFSFGAAAHPMEQGEDRISNSLSYVNTTEEKYSDNISSASEASESTGSGFLYSGTPGADMCFARQHNTSDNNNQCLLGANGNILLHLNPQKPGAIDNQPLVTQEPVKNYLTLLDDEDHRLEYLKIQDEQHLVIEVRNKDMSWPEEMSFIANSSKIDRHKGRHLYELNRTNPIGMKGHMAKCYGDLVQELWSGTQKNVAPLKLRWTIAKYAPRFNGFQQQDSQELLAFLLDGLHEDLNRVHEKPYVELKDSDGRPDWEVAAENFPQDNQKVRLSVSGFLCAFEIPILASPVSACSPVQTDCSSSPSSNGLFTLTANGDLPRPIFIPNGMPNTVVPCGTEKNVTNGMVNGHMPALPDDPFTGYIIAVHRKMMRTELYFLSSQKNRPSLFGMPLIVPCTVHTRKKDLYDAVWIQVSRLASPLPPQEASNHAQDCDDSMGYQYPFTLRVVQKDGNSCAWCPWYRFCRGCKIDCGEDRAFIGNACIAVDWDPTALHLRYQTSQERVVEEHESVEQSRRAQAEPINLDSCLRAFTSEEELGENEMYYCSKCKTHCLATKKLDLWRLPPILGDDISELRISGGDVKKMDVQNSAGEDDVLLSKSPSSLSANITSSPKGSPSSSRKSGASCPSSKNSSPNSSPRTLGRSKGRLRLPQIGSKNKLSSSKENLDASKENGAGQTCELADTLSRGHMLGGSQPELVTPLDHESTLANGFLYEHEACGNGYSNGQLGNHSEEDITDDQREDTHSKPIYNLYAISCHSGILGGGHYVTYAKNPNCKWYCYNDSSCKELHPDEIDTDSAYILFYEQQGIDCAQFLPKIDGKKMADTSSMDEDFESDYKKYCVLQ
ncbi:Ubiquitin carboxyl-terminal hydrolase 32 [Cricetulus griseus]|uniref:ubiquitinyl hydrolase 1 n=1 Tax=Cricetulus griseus TaxID=10029 RepID=G3H9E2_CRIGR|nr:Ubiquitin carboxyl-terminal hydrolase 32 [Cricetulus griseus]